MAGTADNVLAGNLIGVDRTGQAPLPNPTGVFVNFNAGRNLIGTNADGVSDEFERNVISGNLGHGIIIQNSNETKVAGNYIGVDDSGQTALGNDSGVRIGYDPQFGPFAGLAFRFK